MNTREVTLFGIGATLYAMVGWFDNVLEGVVGLPVPATSIVIGMLFGVMPLWGSSSLFVFDLATESMGVVTQYPRLLAMNIEFINVAGFLASGQSPLSGVPYFHIEYLGYLGISLVLAYAWRRGFLMQLLRGFARFVGVFSILFAPPMVLAAMEGIPLIVGGDVVLVGTWITNFMVIEGMWMSLVSPFVVYLWLRDGGLYRRLRGVSR